MLRNPTIKKLKDMKLKEMARIISEPDISTEGLSFEEKFGLIVESEWLAKKNARIKRRLRAASLGIDACVEDISYEPGRKIDKNMVQKLSTCIFIQQKLNVIVTGSTGTGKTYIACALGNAACRREYTVRYFRIPELLLEIQEAKANGNYIKFMASLKKTELLILDDIGLKSYSLEESRDILEVAESRYGKGSMILSGQLEYGKWYELFPDPTTADAIMDRIIHNSYVLALESRKSMREEMAKKAFKELEKHTELT